METKPTAAKSRMHPKGLYRKPGALVITAAVVLLGAFLALALLPKGERIDASGYQVVYLSSGQAYFGKLQNTDGDYLVIKDAFTAQGQNDAADGSSSQTSIVKLSQQVYGPTDTISIKADQVVFWQNLRDDSKVSSAIKSAQ